MSCGANTYCDDNNATSPGICKCMTGFSFNGEAEVAAEANCIGKITLYNLQRHKISVIADKPLGVNHLLTNSLILFHILKGLVSSISPKMREKAKPLNFEEGEEPVFMVHGKR